MSTEPVSPFVGALEAPVPKLNTDYQVTHFLSATERRRVLIDWNATKRDYPDDRCLHQLFEERVFATPEAIALVCEDRSLTYQELNGAANRLGHRLRSLGVGPDALVGIFAERSLEMVIGLLGILKAGGAYLPLDPDYPAERLAVMLQDARPVVVLTQAHLEGRLPTCEAPILCLERYSDSPTGCGDNNPVSGVGPHDLAYVIYTSGSTGVPKGVMNTHRGICNRLLWGQDTYHLRPEDRLVQKTPFSFDVSVWEFFWPLIAGARLVMARPGGHREPSYLAGLIEYAGITVIHFVPSMLQIFLDTSGLEHSCRTLRYIFTSGEALPELVARRCLKRLPARLHNLYGPTEAAVEATYWECRSDDPPGPVPIGKPIANMTTYVLDAQLQPVGIGVAGELFLGGVGVARGYLNRPELTAERFIADPFDARPEARLYRTGDLVRWRPDGNIEFLGRIDDQVKLRGFRIELGEIETALSGHPAISQAAVILREDRPGDSRLVAYLVAKGEINEIDDQELRIFLGRTLPDYMVPSAFVRLANLPLGPNGKLNRKALPSPIMGQSQSEASYIAPRDATEELLASIWQDVLGARHVGIHDNFFQLGGHSLLAVRATARLTDVLGIEIPVHTLFDAPTVVELAGWISRQRQGEASGRSMLSPPIIRRVEGAPPLSFSQQRLWFLDQLDGGLTAYSIPLAMRLRGELDVESLRLAFEAIVARHEPLRTTFHSQDGRPWQRIHPPSRFELPIEDARNVASNQRQSIAAERTRQEESRPFDLTHDLLLRASLLRLADDEHLLLVTMHHIACDGWSLTIFWRELADVYNGLSRGARVSLPELPVRFVDYAAGQRTMLEGERLERLVMYWRERLAGLMPLELPIYRPRRSLSYQGVTHRFTVPGELVEKLRGLCGATGTTLNMVLLAAFQTLLMRECGQEDIAVGVPTAGRGRSELEGLIGFFVNTLVVRVDLSGNPSFRELLGRVRTSSLGAYDHQELPFEQIVEHLRPEREPGRNPLVQVVFQLLEVASVVPNLTGLEVSPLATDAYHARFDLELLLRRQDECLQGELIYRTDLFDKSTIERFSGHFRALIEGIVADPEGRVHELPLLTKAEHQRRIVDRNDTAAPYPRDKCIHELFEERAASFPDAVAVIFEDRSLTYAQLNSQANKLARHLRGMGIAAESRVGLCLKRSPEMMIAILATLKAGGCYVPLDPHDPRERLRLIVSDAAVSVVIADSDFVFRLTHLGVPTVVIGEENCELEHLDGTDLAPTASPTSLAYIMYTSGSTGEPKGVLIENRSVVRLVYGDYATFGPDRVFLQLAPLAFDASTFEIWGALLHGARLVQAPDGPPDLPELGRLIRTQGVTTAWLTAGLFNEIVESRPATLAGLREILTGGEALSVKHVQMAYGELPSPLRIINGYGPTESTTFACCHSIDVDQLESLDNIPIGRPIANTRAYVLDSLGQSVPDGAAGELHLGGDGLARGYLNRPEVTAERFIVHPELKERLYRTGDRVRWLSDGTLEFLGRFDNQVKLRGFRIELEEIEIALCRHPAIRQAVVVVHEEHSGHRRLIAYVVGPDGKFDDDELRAFLALSLANHMIPSAFVYLASFPLNSNGKVDRKALPAPGASRSECHLDHVAPRDEVEVMLASTWQTVLGVDSVGIHDSFFELGGHSLMAVRLMATIEKAAGIKLPISTVLHAGTIEQMAMVIKRTRESVGTPAESHNLDLGDPIVPLQPLGDRPPLFLLPGMNSHVMSLRDLAISIGNEQPIYGLQPTGESLSVLPYSTIEELASELIKTMKRIAKCGPYHLVGFSAGGNIAYEMAQQLTDSGEQVDLLGLLDTYGPGYASLLPLHVRLARHAGMMRWLRLADQFRYLMDRGRAVARRFRNWVDPSSTSIRTNRVQQSPAAEQGGHAWHEVDDRYQHRAYPGQVELFASDKPDWLGTDFEDPTMGWGSLVAGGLRRHAIPGSHLEIIKLPSANEIAHIVRTHLQAKKNGQHRAG